MLKTGYVPGLQQPVIQARYDLIVPQQPDLARIGLRLQQQFALETGDLVGTGQEESAWQAISQWVLLLGSSLHRFAGMPVFDSGKILEHRLETDDSGNQRLHFSCLLPFLPFTNPQHRVQLYKAAIDIIQLLCFERDAELAPFLDTVDSRLLKPIKQMSLAGDSSIPLLHYAYQHDIPFMYITRTCFQLGWGYQARTFTRSLVDSDSALGTNIAGNKMETSMLLRGAGLPVPRNTLVASEQDLLDKARRLGFPLVIKPADRERSEGVSVNLKSERELLTAYRKALELSRQIMLEEHIEGYVHRISLVGEELVLVNQRLPKSVKGDGVHSVRQLIELANREQDIKAPWLRLKPFPADETALASMQRAGFTPESIPSEGELVPLREIGGMAEGGMVKSYTDTIHPDNLVLAQRVRKLFRLTSVGIDLLTTDITRPWHQTGAIINEVNHSPHVGHATMPYAEAKHRHYFKALEVSANRFPIRVFVGDAQALARAQQAHQLAIKQSPVFLTNHQHTVDNTGSEYPLAADSLHQRCAALLRDSDVHGLIVVIQTDEFYHSGFPFNRVVEIVEVNHNLRSVDNVGPAAGAIVELLISALEAFSMASALAKHTNEDTRHD